MTIKRGRPKSETGISREIILTTALERLDQSGPEGFSMRSLALQLNVTPMAIYHHFKNRAALMKDLSDLVYAEVMKDFEKTSPQGKTRDKIKDLLTLYYQKSLQHPHLTLAIFTTPEAFSKEVRKITACLTEFLGMAKMSEDRKQMWLDILVDFTHGSSMATAMVNRSKASFAKEQSAKYLQQLDELLGQIF